MTPQQIKENDNFLCGLEIPEMNNLLVYLTYIGSDKVQYHVFWKDKKEPIFTGKDFRPSPSYAQDSLDAIVSLVDFLTFQKGDIDQSYFESYTQDQLEWRESSNCMDLKYIALDYFNDNDAEEETDAHNDARVYLENKFIAQ